jgi:hypothetical protein
MARILIVAACLVCAGCGSSPALGKQERWRIPESHGKLGRDQENYPEAYSEVQVMPWPKDGLQPLIKTMTTAMRGTSCRQVHTRFGTLINESGDVEKVHVYDPSGDECEAVGSEILKRTKFLPGLLDGKPVKTVYIFILMNPPSPHPTPGGG